MRMAYFSRSSRFFGMNKTLNSYISGHIKCKHFVRSKHIISDFLFSSLSDSSDKEYMCQLRLDQPYPIKYNHMQFDEEVAWRDLLEDGWDDEHCSIIASSGGLVLIYSRSCRSYCVFNPITTEFQLVPSNVAESSVGLAVDDSNRVRLVGFFTWINLSNEKVMFKFTTFGFGSSQYWKEIDPQEFPSTTIFLEEKRCAPSRHDAPMLPNWPYAPVYLHGCMFWLLNRGNILSFDLEKCRATIIDGPWYGGITHWFGQVEGSILLCISNTFESDEYLIYAYDHQYTKTWQIRHKIRRPHGAKHCFVAVFDGERLFMESYGAKNDVGNILVYNTSTEEWKNIGRMPNHLEFHWRRFIPFVPTLAKPYSGFYLNSPESENKLPNNIRSILNAIHQLLSSRNIDD